MPLVPGSCRLRWYSNGCVPATYMGDVNSVYIWLKPDPFPAITNIWGVIQWLGALFVSLLVSWTHFLKNYHPLCESHYWNIIINLRLYDSGYEVLHFSTLPLGRPPLARTWQVFFWSPFQDFHKTLELLVEAESITKVLQPMAFVCRIRLRNLGLFYCPNEG